MTYFSMLFQTRGQENKSQNRNDIHIYYKNKLPAQKAYKMVGNKMVIETTAPAESAANVPCFYKDLNLNKLENHMYPEYSAATHDEKFLLLSLDPETMIYRQNIFKDLEAPLLNDAFWKFSRDLNQITNQIEKGIQSAFSARRGKYKADIYSNLQKILSHLQTLITRHAESQGLHDFQKWIEDFQRILNPQTTQKAEHLQNKSRQIRWSIELTNAQIHPYKESKEPSCTKRLRDILEVSVDERDITFGNAAEDSQLEKWILKNIEKKYKSQFHDLETFDHTTNWPDTTHLQKLADEISFYLRGIKMSREWKQKGYPTTFGRITNEFHMKSICELNLVNASRSAAETIQNDIHITDKKGAFITGINQGGKTTFLRSIGQSIYLTLLGFPAIGTRIEIPFIDEIYSHFSMEETAAVSNGKLVEELSHLREIRQASAQNALILLNEMFSSTPVMDGMEMSRLFISECQQKQQYIFCVTHIPELTEMIPAMESCTIMEPYKVKPGKSEPARQGIKKAGQYSLLSHDIRRRINGE